MITTSRARRRTSWQISAVAAPDDEHELGVEDTQEAGRTIALRNGEDMMSPASQSSREFGLRVSVNKQDPHPARNNGILSHGHNLDHAAERGMRGR